MRTTYPAHLILVDYIIICSTSFHSYLQDPLPPFALSSNAHLRTCPSLLCSPKFELLSRLINFVSAAIVQNLS
jgi:hypothetical protein